MSISAIRCFLLATAHRTLKTRLATVSETRLHYRQFELFKNEAAREARKRKERVFGLADVFSMPEPPLVLIGRYLTAFFLPLQFSEIAQTHLAVLMFPCLLLRTECKHQYHMLHCRNRHGREYVCMFTSNSLHLHSSCLGATPTILTLTSHVVFVHTKATIYNRLILTADFQY